MKFNQLPKKLLRKYKAIKSEDFVKALNDYFYGKEPSSFNVKSLILPGYWYRADSKGGENTRSIMVNTGSGGANLLVDAYRSKGLNDEAIADIIEVFTHGQWVKLSQVKIIDKAKAPD